MSEVCWAEHSDCGAVADHLAAVLMRPALSRLALPGGATPVPILRCLGRRDLGRACGVVTLTDDRLVPHDHPASNFGLLERSFGGALLNVHPLSVGDRPGRFDLVWIGMGSDGHVASIFSSEADRLLVGREAVRTTPDPLPPEAPFDRVTLPMEALVDTDEMILVIRGAEKRNLLEAALRQEHGLPIALLLGRLSAPLTIYWSEA